MGKGEWNGRNVIVTGSSGLIGNGDVWQMITLYPDWSITKSLDDVFVEIVDCWTARST
jgi:hypothetical protein